MFQFRRFPTYTYFIQYTLTGLLQPGCPIRKSSDIMLAYSSPRLIAVNHVLHRLPVPRHSPCALCSLTFFMRFSLRFVEFSLVRKCILLPFSNKNLWPFKDGCHKFPFSLVCLAFLCSVFKVRFQVKTWFQHSIFWILKSVLNFIFSILFRTRSQAPHVLRHLQAATTRL